MFVLLNSRRKIVSLMLTVLTVSIAVLVISYQVVMKFAYNTDNIYYGKSQAAIAQELRDELTRIPGCEPVSFTASDNIILKGFLFRRENAQANLILCHGYKGAKEFMYGMVNLFPEFNILIFDFRASGESGGSYISLGYHEYKDVVAAKKFIKSKINQTLPLIILGSSMGGAATLRAAAHNPGLANAYIVDSSFSDLRTMFLRNYSKRVGLPYYPFFLVIRAMFHYFADCNINDVDSIAAVRMIEEPIMFIHSCNDNFITPEHSISLYTNAHNENSKLWIGPKARHGFLHTYHPEQYRHKVLRFINESTNRN